MSNKEFVWDEYFWVLNADLPSWSRLEDGNSVEIRFSVDKDGEDPPPMSAADKQLVQWVVEHESEILASVLSGVLKQYPEIREEFSDFYEEDEVDEFVPEVSNVDELVKLLSCPSINVHSIPTPESPYFGVQLNCSWDDEHGVGVLLRGTEVLEVGGADTAILLWLAEKYAKQAG